MHLGILGYWTDYMVVSSILSSMGELKFTILRSHLINLWIHTLARIVFQWWRVFSDKKKKYTTELQSSSVTEKNIIKSWEEQFNKALIPHGTIEYGTRQLGPLDDSVTEGTQKLHIFTYNHLLRRRCTSLTEMSQKGRRKIELMQEYNALGQTIV